MSVTTLPLDYAVIKQRQQAVWSAGDYAIIGTTLQIVGERLCEGLSICMPEAACWTSLPATGMRHWPLPAALLDVMSTDYVGALLDRGKETCCRRAAFPSIFRRRTPKRFHLLHSSFDVALSTFGVWLHPEPGARLRRNSFA